jgi:methyl-accepting chemotaxis protein
MTASRGPRGPRHVVAGFFAFLGLFAAALLLSEASGALSDSARRAHDLFLALGLLAIGGYYQFVFNPQLQAERRLARRKTAAGELDELLVGGLDHLRHGDLVGAAGAAHALPGEVGAALAATTSGLESLALQVQANAGQLAGASTEVNQLVSELASGSSQQAASVVEITAAMEELARSAGQIAESSARQADLAQRAEDSGDRGAEAVEGAVAGVASVRRRIERIAERAEALAARSKEIHRILDLITDIAHETHILSLNAAIESAAAGEHGARFALVADEVRRLAQRSGEAVESVRGLLEELAESIGATVAASERASAEATRVVERASSSATAIEDLRATASETAQAAREISAATQQQNAASGEIVLTLREAGQVVQRMASGLKVFADTSQRLSELGVGVQVLAQTYRLASAGSLKNEITGLAELVRPSLRNPYVLERQLVEILRQRPWAEAVTLCGEGELGQIEVVQKNLAGARDGGEKGADPTRSPWYAAATRQEGPILSAAYDSPWSRSSLVTAAVAAAGLDGGRFVLGLHVNLGLWTKR